VVALDSGDYAPFVIDKSVTVAAAPGAHAAISVSSGDGIRVRAGGSDAVVLRNLFLTGIGGRHGIFFETGGSLDLELITAMGFAGRGLRMTAVNAAGSSAASGGRCATRPPRATRAAASSFNRKRW
jgi:hypothetical protein